MEENGSSYFMLHAEIWRLQQKLDRERRLAVWLDINNHNNKANESGISEFDGSIVAVDWGAENEATG